MFGRIRASSSSLDSLERPSSKILKDDSLSIYEATLLKLKLGSQRDLCSPTKEEMEMETDSTSTLSCVDAVEIEASCTPASTTEDSHEIASSPHEEFMKIDAGCPSSTMEESSGDHLSMHISKQHKKSLSVLDLFSKFKSSREGSPSFEVMADDECSASTSRSSIICHS